MKEAGLEVLRNKRQSYEDMDVDKLKKKLSKEFPQELTLWHSNGMQTMSQMTSTRNASSTWQ